MPGSGVWAGQVAHRVQLVSAKTARDNPFITKSIARHAVQVRRYGPAEERYLNHSTFDKEPKGSSALYCVVEAVSALAI